MFYLSYFFKKKEKGHYLNHVFLLRGHSSFKLKRTLYNSFLTLWNQEKNFNEPSSNTKLL